MDLEKIKKDIDKVVEDYRDNWNNHNKFPDDDDKRLATAFRNKQVYKCMYWLSCIDLCRNEIKNPVVSPKQNRFTPAEFIGLGMSFTWEYGKPEDDNYAKVHLEVACEGTSYVTCDYNGEHWTVRIERTESCHIADIAEFLKEETIRRNKV